MVLTLRSSHQMPTHTPGRRTDKVAIRRIRSAEWETHRVLRLRSLSTDPLAFASTFARETGFSEDVWRQRTSRGASSSTDALFVAEAAKSELVGMAVVALVDGVWHVFAMWVEPRYRGRGVGGKLLDASLAWFRSVAPHQTIRLDVNPRQAEAVRLYESRGFRRAGEPSPLGHTEGEVVVPMILDPG